ncbi:hypothetical protein CKAN_00598100 [Cinnamomum micranthum f. kanehirae]|uniref:FK506-binding protein 5-like protein n=1 Tax=Cinnamomum micranthum f. kanehirae TaxID=337451 RepID=A0A3S3Q2L7_9MAGN|nr:hypothetical protein CKAN_00598100 [Cinnamomum micranthum f. kanehirae]
MKEGGEIRQGDLGLCHAAATSISRRKREVEIYLKMRTTYKYLLSFLLHNPPIKTQPLSSFLHQKTSTLRKVPSSKMSLPYDLFLSLFLESLVLDSFLVPDESRMGYVASEEMNIEREVTHAIVTGDTASLRPNSGQPVMIGGHNISVRCYSERGADHRVWEWHGHIMTYDEENGYSLEYIFGNFYERMPDRQE